MIVVAVVVVALVAAGAFLWVRTQRDRLLQERLCDKVVVTLKSGPAFSGVLFKVDDRAVVLRDTQALGAGPAGAHLVVDGELFLFRCDIEYLQRP